MGAESKISVVIVNWNAGRQLRECVDSIIQNELSLVSQIVVVDNGSSDDSEATVEGVPKVTLIRAGENLGFGKACNLGASQTEGEFILFLNPDARVFSNTLSVALKYMLHPDSSRVGICGVQLVDESGRVARSCARFPSVSRLLASTMGIDHICPSLRHFLVEWDHAETREVDQIMGAFFLVRRDLFDELRGFDERFFVYFEEVDFSLRAKSLGWQSSYLAVVQAYHAGGGTSRQVRAQRLFYYIRSRILYSFKHFNVVGASLILMATLIVEPLSRTALALLNRSLSSLKETWRAYGLVYGWLPKWFFSKR